jgi:hypothetical protein
VGDAAATALAGKGKRVGGVFLFMIGAGIILDTHAMWLGLPVLLIGAALFVRGMREARLGARITFAASPRNAEPETQR